MVARGILAGDGVPEARFALALAHFIGDQHQTVRRPADYSSSSTLLALGLGEPYDSNVGNTAARHVGASTMCMLM